MRDAHTACNGGGYRVCRPRYAADWGDVEGQEVAIIPFLDQDKSPQSCLYSLVELLIIAAL